MKRKNLCAAGFGLVLLGACTMSAQIQGTRPAITGISHVVVMNDDLDASSRFYADLIGWPASKPLEAGDAVHYQVGSSQYIEVKKAAGPHDPVDRLDHIAFVTADGKGMLKYLAANGVSVPAAVTQRADGGISFMVTDPEGYVIEFVQGGKFPPSAPATAISTHLMHIGFAVRDEAAEAHFYKDILGFRPYWQGWNKDDGHQPGVFDYKSLQVPEGTDWVEFMLLIGRGGGSAKSTRNPHHFAPGVVSVDAAYAILLQRGLDKIPDAKKPQQGRDGKMQLNLFDPDGLRVELMNFKPSQEPCCSPFTGPHPSPAN